MSAWDLRTSRAYLLGVAEPPAPALAAFVSRHGPEDAAAAVRSGAVPERVRQETEARHEVHDPVGVLEAAHRAGMRLLTPEDPDWPAWPFTAFAAAARRGLDRMVEPIALWIRGRHGLADLAERSVAVVGARAATAYGQRVAAEFGYGLAEHGVTVCSGAAYGVDGAAHRGALSGGGLTVAVLACGIDVGYPAGHVNLLRRIGEDGAVVSEYGPGTKPARHRFLVRNRLIAALSAGTVVVEAGLRSGARSTASAAGALGRVVLAVPGPVTSAMSAGCHAMLRDGEALLVGRVEEVVEATGRLGADLATDPAPPVRATDGLTPEVLRVYEACAGRAPVGAEEVAVSAGVALSGVRAALPELELRGLLERREAGWRQRR